MSALITDGDGLARIDIAASQWVQPPPEAIGWWQGIMPLTEAGPQRPAPPELLLDTLTELLQRPDQAELAYLLALLLVRRRILSDEPPLELEEHNSDELWLLVHPTDGRQWRVPVALPKSDQSAKRLQEMLRQTLFTEQ